MNRLWIVLLCAVAGGCATVEPLAPAPPASEHEFERNYEIGKVESAFVGQPLVKVRDYFVQHPEAAIVRADKSFRMLMPPVVHADVAQGAAARIVGTTQRNGKTYRLVILPDSGASNLRMLLNDDGSFEGSAINNFNTEMGFSYRPDPPDVRMVADPATSVDRSKGYTNFELVYGGAAGDSIQVLYRENAPEGSACAAATQPLVYSLASKHIRFRDIQIDVREATNDHIFYVVTADGMQAAAR
jgi:hypothetical protein